MCCYIILRDWASVSDVHCIHLNGDLGFCVKRSLHTIER
jgi:hypothetical protein